MRLIPLKYPALKLALLSVMHFVTDGLCAYMIFAKLYPDNPEASFLIFLCYNILAFVTQSPVGMLIDKYNKPKIFLAVSMVSMLLGYLLSDFWILSVILIGISNSLFHVAGGKYVTEKSGNDISHLGIFVSTGAIGLVIGQRYLYLAPLPYVLLGLMIICGLLVIFCEDSESLPSGEKYKGKIGESYALLIVLAVVLIRSFVGKVVSPDFTLSGHIFLVIAIATALGKAVGGILSKFIGIKLTTYISMAAAAICLTLGTFNTVLFVIGVFAFNFSMPITLYFANVIMKGKEGFAFGTLAAILIPGYFLAMPFGYSTGMRIAVALMCAISVFLIVYISGKIKNNDTIITTDSIS